MKEPIVAQSALGDGLAEDEILHAYRNPMRAGNLRDRFDGMLRLLDPATRLWLAYGGPSNRSGRRTRVAGCPHLRRILGRRNMGRLHVAFPLEKGNVQVFLRPKAHKDGSFSLTSGPGQFGDPLPQAI